MLMALAWLIIGVYIGAGLVLVWWAYCDRKDNQRRDGK